MKVVIPVDLSNLLYSYNEDCGFKVYEKSSGQSIPIGDSYEHGSYDGDYGLKFDFNIVIVDVRYDGNNTDITYDLYLGDKRIKTDLKISRRYKFRPDSMAFQRIVKEMMFKKLLN